MRWRIPKYFPGWLVSGGGGSGGSATVQTDGVTLQGDGSAGNKIRILQVETQARLTGAGTVASKLDIAGWPLTYWQSVGTDSNALPALANQVRGNGIVIPAALTFSTITVRVNVADAVNSYDMGLYTQAGALVANIGAQTLPTTGTRSFTFVQGSQTISPGLYVFGFTGNAATANLTYDGGTFWTWVANSNFAASVGGALPASIPAQSPSPTKFASYFCLS